MNSERSTKLQTVMAIDYGDRRVGVAIGLVGEQMAFPRETIDRKQCSDFITALVHMAQKERVDALVVGMPYHPSAHGGTLQPLHSKTTDVELFLVALQKQTSLPVYIQDESFSSEIAKSKTAHYSLKQKKDKKKVDCAAAAVFLQNWLDEKGWLNTPWSLLHTKSDSSARGSNSDASFDDGSNAATGSHSGASSDAGSNTATGSDSSASSDAGSNADSEARPCPAKKDSTLKPQSTTHLGMPL
jgi:putative holliday junction resolvase